MTLPGRLVVEQPGQRVRGVDPDAVDGGDGVAGPQADHIGGPPRSTDRTGRPEPDRPVALMPTPSIAEGPDAAPPVTARRRGS